jgi:hypothetical protein
MWRGLMVIFILAVSADNAFPDAENPTKPVMVLGYGLVSCSEWTKERRDQSFSSYVYAGWVLGYLTGVNEWADPERDIIKGTNSETVLVAVDNFCALHQFSDVATASNAVAEDLFGQKTQDLIRQIERERNK